MKYISATVYSFTIWVVASIISGLMCGIYLIIIEHEMSRESVIMISIFFSFAVALPGIALFWICFMICIANKNTGRKLFAQLLNAAFISGLLSALIFYLLFRNEFKSHAYLMAAFGIASAIAAVFVHRSTFLSVFKNYSHEETV